MRAKDDIIAKRKSYRETNKDKIAADGRVYRKANKDKLVIKNRAYRQANKDRIIAYNKTYREINKDKLQHQGRIRSLTRYNSYVIKINEIKMKTGCIDCGYNVNPAALEFDHVKEKSFNISDGAFKSWYEVFEEIAKCELRCANCHRIKTVERYTEGLK